ncbi:MAG TPA: hypothetical protein VF733_00010 [Candidatus Saccharimonadales bacterium]
MNNLEPSIPISLPLAEHMHKEWFEERAVILSGWGNSPNTQWLTASHTIDWAISEGSPKRMKQGLAGLHELTHAPEYDITLVPYRGAKMALAYENAFWQRMCRARLGRKTMNTTYRNWIAVGREISSAVFINDPGRPLSSLAEIILLGTHMRDKNAHYFPFLSLPREESSADNSFANHDGYLLRVDKNGSLQKEALEIVTRKSKKEGTHPQVKEVSIIEVVSGVIARFPDVRRQLNHRGDGLSAKLTKMRYITGLLEKDACGHLHGIDLHILNRVTHGLTSLTRSHTHTTSTRPAQSDTPIESDLARQLREKFGAIADSGSPVEDTLLLAEE